MLLTKLNPQLVICSRYRKIEILILEDPSILIRQLLNGQYKQNKEFQKII